MTKEKETMQKVWWIIIPAMLSFFVWLTISTFSNQATLQVIQTQGNDRANIQEKIWTKVEENNKILSHKLDVDEYLIKHKELEIKIDQVQEKVNKIYNRRSNYTNYIDTLYFPIWKPNSLTKNTE